MKKLGFIFLLIMIILGLYYGYQFFHTDSPVNQEAQFNDDIANLQGEIDKYKQAEQEEKMRQLELQALQNPDIILDKCKEVGDLIVYEGVSTYEDTIRETSFWGAKNLAVKLIYKFGISYDLSMIQVARFVDRTVYIKLDKAELKLKYIELNTEESKTDGTTEWFESQFKPDDVKMIMDNAQIKTKEKINNSKEDFEKAMESLKNNIRGLVLNLDYDGAEFEEV